jgi:hypothetical protein
VHQVGDQTKIAKQYGMGGACRSYEKCDILAEVWLPDPHRRCSEADADEIKCEDVCCIRLARCSTGVNRQRVTASVVFVIPGSCVPLSYGVSICCYL